MIKHILKSCGENSMFLYFSTLRKGYHLVMKLKQLTDIATENILGNISHNLEDWV